jgi:hypothetical protein
MRLFEALVVIIAMCVPFVVMKSSDLTAYIYWTLVSAAYLIFIALRMW